VKPTEGKQTPKAAPAPDSSSILVQELTSAPNRVFAPASNENLAKSENVALPAPLQVSTDMASPPGGSAFFAQRDDAETLRPFVLHVADVLERNPRRVLQFVNCFRLHGYLCARRGLFGGNGKPEQLSLGQLAQFLAVCLRWPWLIADVEGVAATGRNLFLSIRDPAIEDEYPAIKRWLTETDLIDFINKQIPSSGNEVSGKNGSFLFSLNLDVLIEVSAAVARERSTRETTVASP
jgi:hypothetical protein